MMRTPASTRSSAARCAAPAGTASTPTTTFVSSTAAVRRRAVVDVLALTADLADLARVRVEDRGDVDPVLGEDRRADDCLAEAAGPDERDVVLALGPQDLADLGEQAVDRVADAPLP